MSIKGTYDFLKKQMYEAILCFFLLLFYISSVPSFAAYEAVEGRISYLAGTFISTNFQETYSNNNDTQSKLGRSQSFGLHLQALGDLNEYSSLMLDVMFGMYKFCKETPQFLDEYKLEAVNFDFGYRRHLGGKFWGSAGLGSMYSWRVTQQVTSKPTRNAESDFSSLYSFVMGLQYEESWNRLPIVYDLRVRKYMSSHIDDQMSLGLTVGIRFGM